MDKEGMVCVHSGALPRHRENEAPFTATWTDLKTVTLSKASLRDAGQDAKWEEKGTTEDEMVGWHH